MVEENKDNSGKEEEVKQPVEAPKEDTPLSPIEKAEGIVKTIDEKMANFEAMTARMEKVAARLLVGGKANAGEPMQTQEQAKDAELDKKVEDNIKEMGI